MPKDILIKLLVTIREDTIKECEEKHRKEFEENGIEGEKCVGCSRVFPKSRMLGTMCFKCKVWEDIYIS